MQESFPYQKQNAFLVACDKKVTFVLGLLPRLFDLHQSVVVVIYLHSWCLIPCFWLGGLISDFLVVQEDSDNQCQYVLASEREQEFSFCVSQSGPE